MRQSGREEGSDRFDPAAGGGAVGSVRSRRRDRHGRGLRHELLPPHLPGRLSRRDRFDQAVLDSVRPLLERYSKPLAHVEVTVEDVPAADPTPWEEQAVSLGRVAPADREHPARIVLYRRPIETRCEDDADLGLLVRQVLADQVGSLLGLPPEDVDPDAWGE